MVARKKKEKKKEGEKTNIKAVIGPRVIKVDSEATST